MIRQKINYKLNYLNESGKKDFYFIHGEYYMIFVMQRKGFIFK